MGVLLTCLTNVLLYSDTLKIRSFLLLTFRDHNPSKSLYYGAKRSRVWNNKSGTFLLILDLWEGEHEAKVNALTLVTPL